MLTKEDRKEAARSRFLQLITDHGVTWSDRVPDSAWNELKALEKLLDEDEKRELLLGRLGPR